MNIVQWPPELGVVLVTAAIGLPLCLALTPHATGWAVAAALPAIALAFSVPFELRADTLLVGMRFGVSSLTAPFLLLSGILWLIATWFARYYMAHDASASRYHAFHRLAMAGNIGLILAHDLVSFYCFFALMSLASYPLVIHDGRRTSRRAGRIYLVLALAGEVVQFAAFSALASEAGDWSFDVARAVLTGSPLRGILVGLLLVGFGIKAALVPLHVWLPLAHPVAPTPASAVLSGSMIKAGLLGWLNILPVGQIAVPFYGEGLIVAGLAGVFGAAIIGAAQYQPKAVLAYSSISQMGLMIVAVGIALCNPAAVPLAMSVIPLYAFHHALAKCALFLSVGIASSAPPKAWGGALMWGGILFCALALAGFPWTSGAVAKVFLKGLAAEAPGAWASRLPILLSLGAIGTTLLMARFIWTLAQEKARSHGHQGVHRETDPGIWRPWLAIVAVVATGPWLLAHHLNDRLASMAAASKYVGDLIWPVVAGGAVVVLAMRFVRRVVEIPPGDILGLPAWLIGSITRCYRFHRPALTARIRAADEARELARSGLKNFLRGLAGAERYLRSLAVAGVALALLAAIVILRLGGD